MSSCLGGRWSVTMIMLNVLPRWLLLTTLPLAAGFPVPKELETLPNLLAGSFTDGQKFSTGNTMPLIGRPWGFNHWSPQTNDGRSPWWFRSDEVQFYGLRLTHQPSPWIGDWGWVVFGPQLDNIEQNPRMFFKPWSSQIKPYLFDAVLGPGNLRVRMTPTMHGAIVKFNFASSRHSLSLSKKRVCFRLPHDADNVRHRRRRDYAPSGSFRSNSKERWLQLVSARAQDAPQGFGLFLRAEVDNSLLQQPRDGEEQVSVKGASSCFNFSPKEKEVTVRIGTSLISFAQAKLNLDRELGNRSFEDIELEGRLVWRELLGRVHVVDPGEWSKETFDKLTIFYTCLYRALTFPRRLDEVDESGKVVHRSPYDPVGGVHEGVLVTDNGLWDTFRTVYPLLTLAFPEEAAEILGGWLNAFKEGGWLPQWSSPGYRVSMVGTFADVILADAVIKGLQGINVSLAWQAVARDSFQTGEKAGRYGKKHFQEYTTNQYIALESGLDSASTTLDYAFADYAVSFAAEKLGKLDDARTLRDRAIVARHKLFDRKSSLMRARKANGNFKLENPTSWGNGFLEGCSWHYSFPPFDLSGLAELYGSQDALAAKIWQMLNVAGSFQPESYVKIIHEMAEMRAFGMGQYAHNNQPVHHILWLLMALDKGEPECNATDAWDANDGDCLCPRLVAEDAIYEVLRRGYTVNSFPGDEDTGEMGAWYVLAALGLYDPAPGTPHGYALGSPLFRRVEVYRSSTAQRQVGPGLDGGVSADASPNLTIVSSRAGGEFVPHINRVLLDGKDVGHPANGDQLGWTLSYEELFKHPTAQLRFLVPEESADDMRLDQSSILTTSTAPATALYL